MSVNSENQLKFEEGRTTEPLTIMDAGIEEFPFGSKYVVRINPLITGHDHFMPSPGLKKKIEEVNVDVGDKITIEKVAPSEKYQYGYFSVNVVEKGKGPQIAKDRVDEVEIAKSVKDLKHGGAIEMVVHELTLRVEKLEKIEETRSSEAGHKPGDEVIPF
jgi:hypothetical protein